MHVAYFCLLSREEKQGKGRRGPRGRGGQRGSKGQGQGLGGGVGLEAGFPPPPFGLLAFIGFIY